MLLILGFGFLAENAEFARACNEAGIIFVGPDAYSIEKMGSKIEAKKILEKMNHPDVNVIPGYNGDVQKVDFLIKKAVEVGFPVLIKASAGGGGKGMRVVYKEEDLESAILGAKRESKESFGDDKLLIEVF